MLEKEKRSIIKIKVATPEKPENNKRISDLDKICQSRPHSKYPKHKYKASEGKKF